MDKVKKLLREGLLKEKTISNVSLKDFNVRKIIDGWLMSSTETPVALFKYEMQDDYYLTPEEKEELMDADEDEIIVTDRFKKWIKYEAEYRIDNFISEIQDYINDEIITIWREMTVDDKWIKSLPREAKHLGKFWSFEEASAEAHWGSGGGKLVKIQTSVNQSYIDWTQTIEANIDLQIGEDEKEITLFKNTPIKIEALWIDNKEMNIQSLNNKIFLV